MRASARLAVAADQREAPGGTRITRLRSDPPLILRPTLPTGPEPLRRWRLRGSTVARVAVAAAAAGPIGGDDVHLDVEVNAGATLVLRGVAATLALPGTHHEPSCTEVTITVDTGGTLVWLPGTLVAARDCDHITSTRVNLAPGARLLVREELILGRHGERVGSLRQRLRVHLAGRPLHDQELRVGPGAPGFDGSAVTGCRRAAGSVLVVDPDTAETDSFTQPAVAADATAARLPLSGLGVLVSALAPDLVALRHRLDAGLAELEDEDQALGRAAEVRAR